MKKGSSVVIISSIAGYMPQASMAMYGVTKTALLGLTKVILNSLFCFTTGVLKVPLKAGIEWNISFP